ncbi:hypothetical protein HYY70_02830 [Candidatus Woesearchaeota archaeon]|nr:hypothetical protein [Candidatus Woesearchaeota archaeon]
MKEGVKINARAIVLLALLFSIFLVGCAQTGTSGYSTYNQQQQGQYVGGGCGVAPGADYEDTPIKELDSLHSNL